MPLRRVNSYRFPSGIVWPLLQLNRPLADLPVFSTFEPERWEEDGLGHARGFFLALPSGRVVLIKEYDHAIAHGLSMGSEIDVDGREAAVEGFAAINDDVMDGLQIDEGLVDWRPDNLAQWALDARDLINLRTSH